MPTTVFAGVTKTLNATKRGAYMTVSCDAKFSIDFRFGGRFYTVTEKELVLNQGFDTDCVLAIGDSAKVTIANRVGGGGSRANGCSSISTCSATPFCAIIAPPTTSRTSESASRSSKTLAFPPATAAPIEQATATTKTTAAARQTTAIERILHSFSIISNDD